MPKARREHGSKAQSSYSEGDLIIGRNPILETLRAGRRRVHRIMVAEGAHGHNLAELLRLAAERSIPIQQVTRVRLEQLAEHHQGLVAHAAPYPYTDLSSLLEVARMTADWGEKPLLLAVDAVQDPQNFGTLLRTALAVGVAGVMLRERRSVGVTPGVGRASAGAVEHLRIVRVVNLARALGELKRAGLWVLGLDAAGSETYDRIDLTLPLVVVVGSEGEGLGRVVAKTCDLIVRLPMVGAINSLNAAVAGSILLYEALRQRRAALVPRNSHPPC